MRMTLDYYPLRFHFIARDPLRFAPGRAGNVLRGVLGAALHRIAPDAYARVFAAESEAAASGLADRPRPFVLRVRALEDAAIAPGEPFAIGVNLFDTRQPWGEWFAAAFAAAAREGFGPGRARALLDRVEARAAPERLPLAPECPAPACISVRFLTPTELKPVTRPDFAILLARARDRVATLCALYGAGPLDIDFRGMGERAAHVRTLRADVQSIAIARRSSRTGQVHPIGGFTGTAAYQGALGEFLPFLRGAAVTGVGRHTVWGNGEIAVGPAGHGPTIEGGP
jgi:hypothetical protein